MVRAHVRLFTTAALALAFTLPAAAQVTEVVDLQVRGKIVRMDTDGRLIVRTRDTQEIAIFTTPQTRYLAGRADDLRVGAEIKAGYALDGGRNLASSMTIAGAPSHPASTNATSSVVPAAFSADSDDEDTVRGKIVALEGPRKVVIRTSAGGNIVLLSDSQTRIAVDGKDGKLTDLGLDMEVDVAYAVRHGRTMVGTISAHTPSSAGIRPAALEPTPETKVQGKIVRIEVPNRVRIRLADGREGTLLAGPNSRFLVNGKVGRLADLRIGLEVTIDYVERGVIESIAVGSATDRTVVPAAEGLPAPGTPRVDN
jgi:hypothetical protein